MVKRGYDFELKTKKRYEKKGIIFRLSIYSYADFLVLFPNSSIVLIECKTTKKNKWFMSLREKKQFKKLQELEEKLKENKNIKIIYVIRENNKERTLNLKEIKTEYFN